MEHYVVVVSIVWAHMHVYIMDGVIMPQAKRIDVIMPVAKELYVASWVIRRVLEVIRDGYVQISTVQVVHSNVWVRDVEIEIRKDSPVHISLQDVNHGVVSEKGIVYGKLLPEIEDWKVLTYLHYRKVVKELSVVVCVVTFTWVTMLEV